jgi:hypothetical protein
MRSLARWQSGGLLALPPCTFLARRQSTLRAAPLTMPLPPPSSKKHRETPRELATVCQKGNMLEGNSAAEKFDLPRRWKRISMCATISGSFRQGPRGNPQRSLDAGTHMGIGGILMRKVIRATLALACLGHMGFGRELFSLQQRWPFRRGSR